MNLRAVKFRNILITTTLALGMTTAITGCGTRKPGALPPGAINSFDAATYDLLMTSQGALNGFKANLATLPPDKVTNVNLLLNQAIKDYNVAEAGWQAYHAGARGDSAALSASVGQVVADLAALQDAISGTKK